MTTWRLTLNTEPHVCDDICDDYADFDAMENTVFFFYLPLIKDGATLTVKALPEA